MHRVEDPVVLIARARAARAALQEQRTRLRHILEACHTTVRGVVCGAEAVSDGAVAPRLFAAQSVRLGDIDVLVPKQAIRDGHQLRRLTPTEWQLLTFLLSHPGEVLSREEVAVGAWGSGFADRRSEVEVYVSRLRRKLGRAGCLLETVRGRGYRLNLEQEPALVPVLTLEAEAG